MEVLLYSILSRGPMDRSLFYIPLCSVVFLLVTPWAQNGVRSWFVLSLGTMHSAVFSFATRHLQSYVPLLRRLCQLSLTFSLDNLTMQSWIEVGL